MLLLALLLIYILSLIAFPSLGCYIAVLLLNLIHLYSFIKQSPREYIDNKNNEFINHCKNSKFEPPSFGLDTEETELVKQTIIDKHGIIYNLTIFIVHWIPFIIKVTTIIGLITYTLFKLYNIF